MLIVTLQL